MQYCCLPNAVWSVEDGYAVILVEIDLVMEVPEEPLDLNPLQCHVQTLAAVR